MLVEFAYWNYLVNYVDQIYLEYLANYVSHIILRNNLLILLANYVSQVTSLEPS